MELTEKQKESLDDLMDSQTLKSYMRDMDDLLDITIEYYDYCKGDKKEMFQMLYEIRRIYHTFADLLPENEDEDYGGE